MNNINSKKIRYYIHGDYIIYMNKMTKLSHHLYTFYFMI